jgi:hypothetical protein
MRTSFLTGLLMALSAPALADPPWEAAPADAAGVSLETESTSVGPTYVGSTPVDSTDADSTPAHSRTLFLDYRAGVDRHRLDGYTRVTGWRLSESWYFGRQKGGIGGLALVWQGSRDQMTVSTEGLRLIRRF